MFGADGRSRTACLLITNQLLYQLSYVGENYLLKFRTPDFWHRLTEWAKKNYFVYESKSRKNFD